MLQTTAIGFLGQDATIKEVNGKKVTNFSIAHSEKWTDSRGNKNEKTTWVECSMWDAENVSQYLKKGTQIYISGQPDARAWINKEGEPQPALHVRVQRLELLGAKKEATPVAQEDKAKATPKAKAMQAANMAPVDDDLPF